MIISPELIVGPLLRKNQFDGSTIQFKVWWKYKHLFECSILSLSIVYFLNKHFGTLTPRTIKFHNLLLLISNAIRNNDACAISTQFMTKLLLIHLLGDDTGTGICTTGTVSVSSSGTSISSTGAGAGAAAGVGAGAGAGAGAGLKYIIL